MSESFLFGEVVGKMIIICSSLSPILLIKFCHTFHSGVLSFDNNCHQLKKDIDFDYNTINTKPCFLNGKFSHIAWKIYPNLILHNIDIDQLNWNNNIDNKEKGRIDNAKPMLRNKKVGTIKINPIIARTSKKVFLLHDR